MKSITIDRRKPLAEQPHTGHNRWHPDIAPLLDVDEVADAQVDIANVTVSALLSEDIFVMR